MEPNEILALWEKSLAYIALEHRNKRGKKGLGEMADMSRQWVGGCFPYVILVYTFGLQFHSELDYQPETIDYQDAT